MAPAVFVWHEKEWVCDAIKIHKSNAGFSYPDKLSSMAKLKKLKNYIYLTIPTCFLAIPSLYLRIFINILYNDAKSTKSCFRHGKKNKMLIATFISQFGCFLALFSISQFKKKFSQFSSRIGRNGLNSEFWGGEKNLNYKM